MAEQTEQQRYIIVRPDPDATPASMALVLREIGTIKEQNELRNEATRTRFEAMDKAVDLFSANLTRVPTEVQKEVGHLRELLIAMLKGEAEGNYRELLTQLQGNAEAVTLLQKARDLVPAETEARIQHLKDWIIERLNSIETQFGLRDTAIAERFGTVEQQFKNVDNQLASSRENVTTALTSAEKAVAENSRWFKETSDKSDDSTEGQITQLSKLLTDNYAALRDMIETKVGAIDTRLVGADLRLTRQETLILNMSNEIASMKAEKKDDRTADVVVRRDAVVDQRAGSQWTLAIVLGVFAILGWITGLVSLFHSLSVAP